MLYDRYNKAKELRDSAISALSSEFGNTLKNTFQPGLERFDEIFGITKMPSKNAETIKTMGLNTLKTLAGTNEFQVYPQYGIPAKEITQKSFPLHPPTASNTFQGFNLDKYATSPDAMKVLKNAHDTTPEIESNIDSQKEIDRYLLANDNQNPKKTEVSGAMILQAARQYRISPRMLMAMLKKETGINTNPKSKNTPGNIGNDDTGRKVSFPTIWDGVKAAADELAARYYGKYNIEE